MFYSLSCLPKPTSFVFKDSALRITVQDSRKKKTIDIVSRFELNLRTQIIDHMAIAIVYKIHGVYSDFSL